MKKSKYKNKQGSILIGVIIIFLMISSLSVAIISRSLQGTILTTDSKKGYIAYQNSDKNTENFLNSFKTLDNNGGNKIPENSLSSAFCVGINCYNSTGVATSSANKVSDIFSFKAVGAQNQGATRAISAPVPERIDGKLTKANLIVKNCDGTNCNISGQNSYNACDISVKVNASSSFVSSTMQNYEVRKSINSSLAYGANSWETYGWQKVIGNAAGGYFDKVGSTIIKNGDSNLSAPGDQYGQIYYFTIKARNKNPFTLDSLYLVDGSLVDGSGKAPNSVAIAPSKSCSGGDSLSNLDCIATGTNPAGTETYNQSYNCCNGTECYHPIPNWKNDPTSNCALEKCVYAGDEVGVKPIGDSTTGYCGTSQVCQEGKDCAHPYRTIAYCTSAPSPSTQIPGTIVATNWSLQNYQDVYMSSNKGTYPNPPDTSSQPRCAHHDCPSSGSGLVSASATKYCGTLPYHGKGWDATGTTCAPATCGEYTLSKSCILICNSPTRYSPYSGSAVTGYSSGTACAEVCPSTTAPFTSDDPQTTEGACSYTLPTHGTSWTNSSSCQSNTRPATESQHGYTVTESCSLNCSNNYTPTNPTDTSSACCTQSCNTNTWNKNDHLCPTPPTNGSYVDSLACQSNQCGDVSTIGSCSFRCSGGNHITYNPLACTYNYNYNVSCGSKVVNSSWVNGSTYTQNWISDYSAFYYPEYTWYGNWSSASAYLGSGTCGYTCNSGFHSEDGTSCVSDTNVVNCPSIPPGATRTGDATYTQTRYLYQPYWWYPPYWTGTPVNTSFEGSGTCGYTCGTGKHAENNSSCVSNTRSCYAPTHATASPTTVTWTGSSWPTCSWSCNSGYYSDGSACYSNTKQTSCGTAPWGYIWVGSGKFTQTASQPYLLSYGWYYVVWTPATAPTPTLNGTDGSCGYKTP